MTRKAQIEGFSIAKEGETAIRAALDRLATQATGKFDEPYKVFGRMFHRLSHEYRDERGFAPFRQILRECILDHWAVPPGKMLLGEIVHELRVHTVRSAALETGVEPGFLEQFLIDAGAIDEKDTRPYSRKTFDAQAHASLLNDIRELVGTIAMRHAMNATKTEFMALEADGILVPRTRRPKVRKRWRLSDGRALVEELQSHCVGVAEKGDGWETLQQSRLRTGIRLPELIEAIHSHRIKCGQRMGTLGYHGIVVLRAEADVLAETVPSSVKNSEFDLPGVMSAAAFGRSLGLRDKGYFHALVEAGHTPAEPVINPRTHRSQYQVSASDIETFHRKFVTLRALADETGLHRNTLRSLLLKIGVGPFSPNGEDFGPVYLRTEIQEALAAMRAQNLRGLFCGPEGIRTASKRH